ncbi:MAG TPA: hypothetical protein VMF30_12485 [Pirellulales bacterium]|nr:hypothetical protein [Pirellulales bacterium]
MRRLAILLVVAWSLGVSGCAMRDAMYSLFGGMNSNDADMNRTDQKNAIDWLAPGSS